MRAQKRATEVALSCMESLRQSVALVFHLLLDQITNGGRTGGQHFLLAQILHGFLLVLDVLGLDRQADDAGLAVNTDDLGFDFVADVQHVARIFNAVTADFGGLQGTFDVVTQGNYRTLGVNLLDGTGNDAAKGAVVTLGDDIEGTLKASEISRDRVEDARIVLNVGDEVEAKIIGVDRKTRVISLSIKAKDVEDEKEAMQDLRKQEMLDAGPTTIADLIKQQMENKGN